MSYLKVKQLITVSLILGILFLVGNKILAQAYNFAQDSGLNGSAAKAGFVTTGASTFSDIIGTIIYIILGLVGAAFMSLVIYGGVTWMTARGNEEKVKKANSILMNALLGLIVTLSAYVISYLIITYFWK